MTPGSLSILLLQDRKICRHLTAICISGGEAGPEAKFESFSAHRETFKPMPVAKAVKYKPKENIKTFDNNYLQALEQNILNNKAKIRSVSLQSLRDEAIEVDGEDEILYKAGHYTNTFQ